MAYKQERYIALHSGGWKSKLKAWQIWCLMRLLSGRGKELFYKNTNPIDMALPLWLNHLSETSPSNAITWGFRFNLGALKAHIQVITEGKSNNVISGVGQMWGIFSHESRFCNGKKWTWQLAPAWALGGGEYLSFVLVHVKCEFSHPVSSMCSRGIKTIFNKWRDRHYFMFPYNTSFGTKWWLQSMP